MKTLVIAEKPSVGRDIARVLKCSQKGDGFLSSDTYIVSWAIGHLAELCEPEDYDASLKSWKMDTLPIIPEHMRVKPAGQTIKQFNLLKKLMNGGETDRLICATDSGREGELIFRYIYQLSGCKKPFDRLWISSMTDAAINEGFRKLKPGAHYDMLYYSAKSRSESDWLVGINATRAYSIRYGRVLSVGRVQTPTLALIVEKQKEIDAFVPVTYWEVQAAFQAENKAAADVPADISRYSGTWFDPANNDTKIPAQEKAKAIAAKVKGKPGVVERVASEEKRVPPERLYDLTELQRECNRRFGFPAQKTLSVAQELYEKRKLITYPRTDSRYLSTDLVPKLKQIIAKVNVGQYTEYAQRLLNMPDLPVSGRIVDNSKISDHHAIIPTEAAPKLESLTADELKVYDLVVRRFLSVFYPYYIYNAVKIVTLAESERFMTKGNIVVSWGWMELYKKLDDSANVEASGKDSDAAAKPAKKSGAAAGPAKKGDETAENLPDVRQGDAVLTTNAKAIEKKTKPPAPYTEGTLLSAMENAGRFVEDEELRERMKDSGLGTPATRAAIIERLLDVGYLVRKGRALAPTEKGVKLVEIVPMELKSPETTGKWEKGLASIAKGNMARERFMGSIEKFVRFLVDAARKSDMAVQFPEEVKRGKYGGKPDKGDRPEPRGLGKCPMCKNEDIFENSKAFYCGGWKKGCKFTIWKGSLDKWGVKLDADMMAKLLKDGKIDGLGMTLPQTGEKCVAGLVLRSEPEARVEWVNVERVKDQQD
ncbi:MAG: DNA topoisomerase III [Defluviitaleaceae bacterium]|nr:DNA topoisomerase III [Defluviitaleaceae bacterium]